MMATDPKQFEEQRLAMFANHGFDGESRWVTDRQGRRTYLIARGEGPCPTVLIHGGLSQAGEWGTFAGHLPGPVVIPDRPGCGLSYPIDYAGTDYRAEAAAWVRDLVDGLGADQVDLVGNSMGGYFAMAFALAHPDRVRRLAFLGAPAGLDRTVPLFLRLWGHPVLGRLMGALGMLTPSDPELVRKRIFASFLVARPETVPADLLEITTTSMAIPGTLRTSSSILRHVLDLGGWRKRLMMRDALAGLDVPTLFVRGDRDAFAPPASAHDMAARMADARVEVIHNAGHLPYIDDPEAVARAVTAFLPGAVPLRAAG
jgi:abhydrolase domain-containing protein 6